MNIIDNVKNFRFHKVYQCVYATQMHEGEKKIVTTAAPDNLVK